MPILHDLGDAGVARVERILQHFAARLGIDKEYAYAFFNGMGRLPANLGEFQAYLNDPSNNPYGFARRDATTGALRGYLHPGDTPGTRGAADPGFRHVITNAEDTAVQRFREYDPAIFDYEQVMAQTPTMPAATGPRTAQAMSRTAQGANPYPVGSPYHDTWEAGNPSGSPYDPNTPPSTGGGVPPASSGGASGGGGVGGNAGYNPAAVQAAIDAATIAYQNKRIELDRYLGDKLDEREKHRIALEAARDAAAQTGYVPGSGMAGKGQAVMDALAGLRTNPQYQAADGDTRRRMEAATVSQATGMDLASAAQGIDRLRALTATTGQMSTPQLVEQVFGQTPGGAGTPTLDREKEQNQTAMDALRLLSTLRGPENAFAYANTLANVPESIRRTIAAATARLPMTARNPAQAGLMGDVGWTGQAAAPGTAAPGGVESYTGATGQAPPMAYQAQGTPQATTATGAPVFRPPPTGLEPMAAGQQGGNVAQAPAYGPRTTPQQPLSPAVAAGMQAPNLPFRAGGLSPTDMLRANPYATKVMWGGYENAGGDIEAGKWEFAHSLPRAVGPRSGTRRAA